MRRSLPAQQHHPGLGRVPGEHSQEKYFPGGPDERTQVGIEQEDGEDVDGGNVVRAAAEVAVADFFRWLSLS